MSGWRHQLVHEQEVELMRTLKPMTANKVATLLGLWLMLLVGMAGLWIVVQTVIDGF